MEQLKDLGQIYNDAAEKFNKYDGADFVLPSEFKEQVKEINSNVISYNKYSAIIMTKGNQRGALNIYMPNQWFYIASYFTDFYKELIKYRNLALKTTSKERLKILDKGTFTEQEEQNINSLELDKESKAFLKNFITDYSWWHGAKTIDRADFFVSPILTCAGLVNASQTFVADLCAFLAGKDKLTDAVIKSAETVDTIIFDSILNLPSDLYGLPLQQIYYGAPGTGKSYEINEITKNHSAIRTTFHPDSDYSTFVGAYKPVMSQVELRDVSGHVVIEDGKKLKEERITYKYVKQAFLKAYLAAWQKYAINGRSEVQFLIIEEINRGNCAQIFGDLFQLLDRGDDNFSTYPIEADTDLQTEISKAFGKGGEYEISNSQEEYCGLTDDIKEGRVMLLPPNLYIWATMNTSDQSLFPIDSAFKRRWDWNYVKISDAKKGWKIKCGSEECDWWTFVTEINKKIAKETSSDDKKLGYFFCKPDKKGNKISEDKFVGKVLFYLWNDVFKDGDTSLFKVGEYTEEAKFEAFYNDDNTVNIEAIRKFLVAVVGDNNINNGNEEGPSSEGDPSNGIDYTKYSFDGETRLSKKDLGYKIVMKYINEHSDKSFEELQKDLAFDESVDNKYRYKGVLAKVEEVNGSYQNCFGDEQTSSDNVNYKVLTWWNKYNIDFIINFAKKQGWSVEKETE